MIHKIFFILIAVLTMSGFKLLTSNKWSVSENDPTIWIKLCNDIKTATIKKNDLGTGDTLSGASITGITALASVMTDFNEVNSSYLRFAAYPDDPQNPGTPEVGDSTFTIDKADKRTIDVCFTNPTNPFEGGSAKLDESGDKIIGCTIVIKDSAKKSAKEFLRTLTHELGHCAGLDHPQETKHAIMSYFTNKDDYRLMIDDKMGLVFLFAKDGVNMKERANLGLSCSRTN